MSKIDREIADTDIAIIGMACRFPGAPSVRAFWANLVAGEESISLFDASQACSANPTYSKRANFRAYAGVLYDIENFDAGFFGYSAREAELMDPQQRLFLECAWETFEDAGYVPHQCEGLVGVYAGCGINTYLINNVHPGCGYFPNRTFLESVEDFQLLLGNQSDFLSTRVSFKLNLRGPSINLQTACSTSLVAVHLACQSLILGECDMALAGCSTLRVPQDGGYLHEEGMVFSSDGHTRAFDAKASGTTFGSGVAAVLLKPLKMALTDGDVIHAVIKGSAVNNDGANKLGFTAPSIDGQAAVIQEALAVAGVEPGTIGYVEAHGTATPLGDPIEIAALKRAFGDLPPYRCAIGTAKTNLGHLSWSAGMAGLIKTVLALKHAKIPPSLHYESPNPRAQLEGSPFQVNDRLVEWPTHGRTPRRAGVSAFGVGGTNAHIVLQESPGNAVRQHADAERPWHVLTLSARCETALAEMQKRFLKFLDEHAEVDLADLCYTGNTGRAAHPHRCAVVASSTGMLRSELTRLIDGQGTMVPSEPPGPVAIAPQLCFLFTGQGAQYLNMGRQLYDTEPLFRQTLQQCDRILQGLGHDSILQVIYPPSPDDLRLHDVTYTQTAMFSVEYALAKLWMSWGVHPTAVMGHSAGEYAAACIAGVFSLEDGLRLCAERGCLFRDLVTDDGLMASVSAPEAEVYKALAPYPQSVSIAAVNGPLSTVISGQRCAVEEVCAALATLGISSKMLEVQRAGHSPLTERMLDGLHLAVSRIKLHPPRIPIVSNLTGQLAGDEIATPEYWCRHTRETVLFSRGMRCLADMGIRHFLEIGPDSVLLGMGAYCMLGESAQWIPSLRRPVTEDNSAEDWRHLSNALARLFTSGMDIDWHRVYQDRKRRRISLPTYPFQRSRHWIEACSNTAHKSVLPSDVSWTRGLLQVQWVPQNLPALEPRDREDMGTWLLLADAGGLAEQLRDRLASQGEGCHLVFAAANYESFEGSTNLRRDTPEHFTRLLAAIKGPLRGVVDLWPCDNEQTSQWRSGTDALRTVWQSCEGMLQLAKVLVARVAGKRLTVATVTRDAQAAAPGDGLEGMGSAPLWAMARVMSMEHPELQCLRIDLELKARSDDADRLLSELRSSNSDDAIAWRGESRLVARLTRAPAAPLPPTPTIRPDGSYLITGGLGGVGLLVASWLVEQGARHILLMGRQGPGPEALAAIGLMSEKGARVQVLRADVTNTKDLQQTLSEAEGHPTLRGVFHAAGIVDDAVLLQQDRERFLAVLGPKVEGAWNLHKHCLSNAPQLEHFVLFSSAASLIGNAGQANHAAANAFLDALAHHRLAQGAPALSINWGAWSDVGELRKNTVARQRVQRLGFEPIPSQDGLLALAHAMKQASAQLGMSPMDWTRYLPAFGMQGVGFYAEFASAVRTPPQRRNSTLIGRLAGANPSARQSILLEHVRSKAARVLGLNSADSSQSVIDDDRRLAEYGLDSLSAIELRNSLQNELQQALPAMLVMDHPTVSDIAQHLAGLNFNAAAESVPVPVTQLSFGELSADRELSMQQRRWLSLIRAGYGARVVPVLFYAALDEVLFRRALEAVVSQHELLRYTFPDEKVRILPIDAVLPPDARLFSDLSGFDDAQRSAALADIVRQCWKDMPDPALRPSWGLRCLKYPGDRFLLLLSLQHLDFDGTALTTFVTELRGAYRALLQGLEPPRSEVAPYHEYVQSQKAYMKDAIKEDRAFFQGLYATLQRTTTLPGHQGFERTVPHESTRHTARVPAGLWGRVQTLAGRLGVTAFSILLAAYARLLGDLTSSTEVVIAMITNGRPDQRFQSTIGPFTAPFPVKVSVGSVTLHELAVQCHRTVASITARSRYPVSDLVSTVSAFKGFPADSYFTDVGINFTNYRRDEDGETPRARVIEVLGPVVETEFVAANTEELRRIPGLHLVLDIFEGELRPNFWFHTARFSQSQVSEWAERYVFLLCELVGTNSPDTLLTACESIQGNYYEQR